LADRANNQKAENKLQNRKLLSIINFLIPLLGDLERLLFGAYQMNLAKI